MPSDFGVLEDHFVSDAADGSGLQDLAETQDLAGTPDVLVRPDVVAQDLGVDPGTPSVDEGSEEDVALLPCPLDPCVEEVQATPQGCVSTFMEQGVPCDDLDEGTKDDQCDGLGTCSGTTYTCDDATLCTPTFAQDGSGCIPQYAALGTPCDDNDSNTVDDKCDGAGGCAGSMPCFDLDAEPNNSAASAISLGTIGDCDGDGGSITGVLNGTSDVDWYTVGAEDGFTCSSEFVLTLTGGSSVEACVFTACNNEPDETEVDCNEGSEATAPNGHQGCCATGLVKVNSNCPGFSDDVTALIRIRKQGSGGTSCTPYSFDYHN
jgi:hypothetical protein